MLEPGMQLTLTKDTLAIALVNGKRVVSTIPSGDVIEILPDYRGADIMVEVEWQSQQLTMFSVDVISRSEPVLRPQGQQAESTSEGNTAPHKRSAKQI